MYAIKDGSSEFRLATSRNNALAGNAINFSSVGTGNAHTLTMDKKLSKAIISVDGVAQSHNYYPVSHMKRNQGIGFIALGLGKTIAEGKKSLRFSPYYPDIISQFYSSNTLLDNSQNQFFALDLNNGDNLSLIHI